MRVDKRVNIVEKSKDATVIFKEFNHLLIEAGKMLVMLVFTRVIDSAAIENITATIAGDIVRNTFFISKAIYTHLQFTLRIKFGELLHLSEFGE